MPRRWKTELISNTSAASPTLQLILQPFRCFTYVTAHSPTLPSLQLRHSTFSNPSVVSSTSQLILKSFRRFTYVADHSPILASLQLRHRSLSNPCVASPTSQLILKHLRRFTYVTAHSSTLPLLHLRHRHFTYVTLRGVHDLGPFTETKSNNGKIYWNKYSKFWAIFQNIHLRNCMGGSPGNVSENPVT